MSPARISIEDMSESELSSQGMWCAQPYKKQKMQHEPEDIDLVDDLETLWETRWKLAVSRSTSYFPKQEPRTNKPPSANATQPRSKTPSH